MDRQFIEDLRETLWKELDLDPRVRNAIDNAFKDALHKADLREERELDQHNELMEDIHNFVRGD